MISAQLFYTKLATLLPFSSIFNDDEKRGGGKDIGPLTPYLSVKIPYLFSVQKQKEIHIRHMWSKIPHFYLCFGLEGGAHTQNLARLNNSRLFNV